VQVVDGWRLRAAPGVDARRSNSVLPIGGSESVPLEEKLGIVEDFYGRRGKPVRYQVSPAVDPPGLDEVLAERGFEVEASADIMVADLAGMDEWTVAPESRVVSADSPDDRWLSTLLAVTPRADPARFRETILDRIGPPAVYVVAVRDDQPLGVGMAVAERGWLGIFSMATLPHARRRGTATAVLNELAVWGRRQGATRAYLQTERDNEAAHALYERAGFRTAYGYHYRTRESASR
jgi:GNAT superfamily N-acetyltransferase